jgi:hypothetical protein
MAEEDSIRTQIVNIYAVHNPEKLGLIDELLGEWRGEEEELLANIKEKCVKETRPPLRSNLNLGERGRVLTTRSLSSSSGYNLRWNTVLKIVVSPEQVPTGGGRGRRRQLHWQCAQQEAQRWQRQRWRGW